MAQVCIARIKRWFLSSDHYIALKNGKPSTNCCGSGYFKQTQYRRAKKKNDMQNHIPVCHELPTNVCSVKSGENVDPFKCSMRIHELLSYSRANRNCVLFTWPAVQIWWCVLNAQRKLFKVYGWIAQERSIYLYANMRIGFLWKKKKTKKKCSRPPDTDRNQF